MTEILTDDGVLPNYITYANAQRKSGLSRTHFRRLVRERELKKFREGIESPVRPGREYILSEFERGFTPPLTPSVDLRQKTMQRVAQQNQQMPRNRRLGLVENAREAFRVRRRRRRFRLWQQRRPAAGTGHSRLAQRSVRVTED